MSPIILLKKLQRVTEIRFVTKYDEKTIIVLTLNSFFVRQ